MDHQRLLKVILDIGKEMIISGAEIWRVEDSVRRMLDAYGFARHNVWVISSCIQATVETNDGEIYTQIREVGGIATNLDRLDYLNNLSRFACANTPDPAVLEIKLAEVLARPGLRRWVKYLASVMAASCFTVFFNGDAADAFVAGMVVLAATRVGETIRRHETNPLIYNTLIAFMMEVMTILLVYGQVGHNMSTITIGVIMLLISGLGLTNGIRDLLQRNTLSGISTISNAVLGAAGIAIGISLAMLAFRETVNLIQIYELIPNAALQLLFGTVGCVGFALLFGIKGRQIIFSGIGAFCTWAVYLLAYQYIEATNFVATLVAAAFVAAYAGIMARVNKAPATIFLTASVFPLIPGASLYYTVFGLMMKNHEMYTQQGYSLLTTCLGIAFGFIIVEVLTKYASLIAHGYLGIGKK